MNENRESHGPGAEQTETPAGPAATDLRHREHRPGHHGRAGLKGSTARNTPLRRTGSDEGRYAERRAAKRELYLEAAAEIVARRGPSVSMEEIAVACGVTKPILYRHFGDRSGLVRALAERFAAEMFVELDEALATPLHPRTLLSTTIDAYLRLLEKDPSLYQFVTQRAVDYQGNDSLTMVGDFQREVGRRVAVVMGEKMREAGMDSGGVEPIAQGIVGLVHSAGDWWIERRSMPRARLVSYISDLTWGGLVGMSGPS